MTPLRMLLTMWRKNRSSAAATRLTPRLIGDDPSRRRPGPASEGWDVSGMSERSVPLLVTRQLDSIRGKRCAEPRYRMCEERPIKSSGYEKPHECHYNEIVID